MGGAVVGHVRPDKSGIQIYRLRFPQHLVEFIPRADGGGMGRKELRVSLRARDINEAGALDRLQAAKAEYARIVERAEKLRAAHEKRLAGSFDPLDRPTIAYLAEKFLADHLALAAASRSWRATLPEFDYETRTDKEADYDESRELLEAGDTEGLTDYWSEYALALARSHNLELDRDTEAFSGLCHALGEAACELWLALEGDRIAPPPQPVAPARADRKEAVTASQEAVSLLDVYDRYAAAREIKLSGRKEARNYLQNLIDFVGHDDAARLTRDDLVRWRDHLLVTPRLGKQRKPVTVRDKYLMVARCTLGAALDEKKVATNVAADVRVLVPKRVLIRDPDFTMDEAKAILQASLVPPTGNLSAPNVRARRWIPWLCAYTGCRVNEMSQLRKKDIRQVDGVWIMNITPEAGSVKTGQFRETPLHQHIIEQGFLEMVKSLPEGPLFHDPAKRRTVDSDDDRHVKKVGERLAKWVRCDVGVDDPNIKPNHAWRHTFNTLSAEAGIQERVAMAIQGHAPGTVARKYGKVSIKAKADALAIFPRFSLDHAAR